MQIEPWYIGPVPTYRVNKHKDRRDFRQQTADRGGGGGETLMGGYHDGAHAWQFTMRKRRTLCTRCGLSPAVVMVVMIMMVQ
jgi:hypothetical protein